MTHRSDTQDACRFCHGKLSLIVSRDPDEEVDCVCVDPSEVTDADRVETLAQSVGIELTPWQREVTARALSGEPIQLAFPGSTKGNRHV